jgi:SHS2 domain-containing protein
MAAPRWEHFQHEADMGVRGCAGTLEGAFEQAALAMTAVITTPETIAALDSVTIHCSAPDTELLFVDWLNAVVYEMAVRRMLFSRFEVHIDNGELRARIWGEPTDVARHTPAVEIKGATYTALRVEREPGGDWCAQCIVDV